MVTCDVEHVIEKNHCAQSFNRIRRVEDYCDQSLEDVEMMSLDENTMLQPSLDRLAEVHSIVTSRIVADSQLCAHPMVAEVRTPLHWSLVMCAVL